VAIDEGKDGLPDTRRRVLQAVLNAIASDEDMVDEIIQSYAAHRLLTLDNAAESCCAGEWGEF
jgi:hypothetical protein